MKTKELIELLQQEDPSGECHVRISGECPIEVTKVPGYYDGSYTYMENDKLILSTEGDKVDIDTLDIKNFIWQNYQDWENKVEFRYTFYEDDQIEKEIRTKLATYAQDAAEFDKQSIEEFSSFIIDKIKNGYKIIQKDTQIGHYNTMFFTKDDEEIKLRRGDCHAIIRGSFKPKINKDYIEWELEKGDN
jgi:hypothetical protein